MIGIGRDNGISTINDNCGKGQKQILTTKTRTVR